MTHSPEKQIKKFLKPYLLKKNTKIKWVQEEPRNMGAWNFIKEHFILENVITEDVTIECVSRMKSASPSTGLIKSHKQEEIKLIERAFE